MLVVLVEERDYETIKFSFGHTFWGMFNLWKFQEIKIKLKKSSEYGEFWAFYWNKNPLYKSHWISGKKEKKTLSKYGEFDTFYSSKNPL